MRRQKYLLTFVSLVVSYDTVKEGDQLCEVKSMPPPGPMQDLLLGQVLKRLQGCIHSCQYKIRDTKKNNDTLSRFGWTIEDQESILHNLLPSDCYKVDYDNDQPESQEFVYKFHKGYCGHLLYIKMTFRIIKGPDGESDFADIMSLHIDDFKDPF